MKRFLWVGLMAGVTACAGAADFSRVDAGSIAMRGPIAEGDVDKLRLLATPGTALLRVNSDAGDPQAAMQLGRYLRQRQWRLAIDTMCAGSCALYVFPAALRKNIPADAVLALQESAFLRAQDGPGADAPQPASRRAWRPRTWTVKRRRWRPGWQRRRRRKRRLRRSWALPPPFTATSGRWRRRPIACASAFPTRRRPSTGGRPPPACSAATASPRARGDARGAPAPDGYLYVPALSALVMGDQALQVCP